MSKSPLATLGLVAALSLGGPALLADKGDKGDKHSNDRDHQGWEQRDGYEYRTYGKGEEPPGWGHGKKTGWGNCGLPPGQAKKYGCRTYTYQGRPYYYYQEQDGRIMVRRPTIEVHGSVDIAH